VGPKNVIVNFEYMSLFIVLIQIAVCACTL